MCTLQPFDLLMLHRLHHYQVYGAVGCKMSNVLFSGAPGMDEQGYANQYGLSQKVSTEQIPFSLYNIDFLLVAHFRFCQTFLGEVTIGLY